MTQSLSQIRALLARYSRANGAGSIKVANTLVPDIIELLIDYVDEATGKKAATESDVESDLAYFAEKLRRCEITYGEGSPNCAKMRAQLTALEDAVVAKRAAASADRKVFYVDTGRLAPEKAKEFLTETFRAPAASAASVDLATLSEDDQAAYVEAQFRHQGIVNNGARYTGTEERVEHFLALLNAPAEVCAPCEVQNDGTSAIDGLIGRTQVDALVAEAQADAEVAKVQAAAKTKRAPAKKTK